MTEPTFSDSDFKRLANIAWQKKISAATSKGAGMPIKWSQSRQEKIEVAEWVAGIGPVTLAVIDATMRYGVTFAAALVTRKHSEGFSRN